MRRPVKLQTRRGNFALHSNLVLLAAEGRQVVFEPITLQPRDEKVYEVLVKALRPGDVRFRVDLTADQLTAGPVHREESTTIYNPNIPPP